MDLILPGVPDVRAPGEEVTKKGVYVYRCVMCGRTERYDDKYGPACTGPSWTDEHPMEPMALVGTDKPRPTLIVPGR